MGLRGFAGKPFHPPLTDIPIGAYVLAAAFDLVSWIWASQEWSRDFYRAATFALIGGAVVSLGTALTGFLDWYRSAPKGTQARRTASAHGLTMATVTVLVLADIGIRLASYSEPSVPAGIAVLTIVVAAMTALGATIGGSLVYDYGFNVQTARDSAVWHRSEQDVMPGQKG
jgi:uncharacterized membrane protein